MAHMIDTTTGRAAIAYVGATPWHGLGQALTPGADIDTWTREAGLGYRVLESPVLYNSPAATELQSWPNRKVLHRSDTGAPLAVVSDGYRVVQPGEVMDFFRELVKLNGFQLETAGALSDGRRVWALASVGDAAPVVSRDIVKPYLLLATSYDGTMATVAKFTAIRVVCNNTITAAVGGYSNGAPVRGEAEIDTGYLKSAVRVLHSESFKADAVRMQLGIAADAWERFLINSRQLASVGMDQAQADDFVATLLAPWHRAAKDVKESKAFGRIMQLFNGGAIGHELPGVAGTRWGMLNAVTELVDHERGRSNNTRIESAWFGTGAALKSRAVELLSAGPDAWAQENESEKLAA
jgi:phage/plasmid-like protein (TIGR03299 family)